MKRLWIALTLALVCLSAMPDRTLAHSAAFTAGIAPSAPAAAAPAIIPTTVALANNSRVSLLSVTYNPEGTSTWRYRVAETGATNLTAWALEAPACATVTTSTPSGVAPDSSAGFTGIKWATDAAFQQGEFSVTLNSPVTLRSASVATIGASPATGKIAGPVCATAPLTVTLSNGYRISLRGVTFNADGASSWDYFMEELASAQDLSNWVLDLKNCAIVTAAPEPWEIVKPDPNAKLYGVKWQTGAGFQQGEFSVTLRGPLGFGPVQVAAKGPDVVLGQIAGPLCAAKDVEPPPVIVIDNDDIEQEIERIDAGIFVNISITVVNTGGDARGVFLVLSRAEFAELFDLADITFLEHVGFVNELGPDRVVIGLGRNNKIAHDEKVKLKIKFKVRSQITVDIKFNARFSLIYGGTGGAREVLLPPVIVVVPVVVLPGITPIGNTPAITPTSGITPTGSLTPTVIVIQRLPIERIDARFVRLWRVRGGLAIFGLPLTDTIVLPSGITVQYFERARLEYHPELAGTQYEVLIGLLGVELGYATAPVAAPTSAAELRWYFPATGHLVAGSFRSYWQTRGGLLLFGYPISEVVTENGRQVQYFERARLELHPELAGTPYEVQLGHLGVLVGARGR
jgi:hypothetical protein